MSWNAPQTLTEALRSIEKGFAFRSRTGVLAEPVWVLTDITKLFYKADDFSNDLVARNWFLTERYMKEGRKYLADDLVYVVAREGVALVAMLRDGTILKNERELPKPLETFRDKAVKALQKHKADGGHLNRYEG